MDSTPSIFMTRSECENNIVLSKFEVMQTIPENALSTRDIKQSQISAEWRWRIFKLPHKENEIIEISFKKPNEARMYMTKSKKWVIRDIDESFDQYLVKEYYVYAEQ
jgi:hypothetical protein